MRRLAVLCDYVEEDWASMDLVAQGLLAHRDLGLELVAIRPTWTRRFGRLPLWGKNRSAFNADRVLNRYWDYPSSLRRLAGNCDLFHVVDHSYAQLVHALPTDRTGVFCHDLNTFRCLLEPEQEKRSWAFRALVRRTLHGLRRARIVFHSTDALRREIERLGIVDPSRLVKAPYGVSPEFSPRSLPGDGRGLGPAPFLLHVGSCIARKRVDVLLEVFARLRARRPNLRLVQVGGEWTPAQRDLIGELRIQDAVTQLRDLTEAELAGIYRKASVMLMTSQAEGFGLPLIEALACGRPVVASDLPSLREVGGDAAVYCPAADVPAWISTVDHVLSGSAPSLGARLAQAARFTWTEHARIIVEAYRAL